MPITLELPELDNKLDELNQKVDHLIQTVSEVLLKSETGADELISPKELCKLFKISKQTIANWQNKGLLKPCKIGRSVYYKRFDLLELIDNKLSA